MDNFNFNLFKYFYYVAYYKGFTNASKHLNIVQSALSYNIKTLESQLNKTLIVRNSKNFELTEEGYNIYENLKSVFEILEQNFKSISNLHVYEELTIGVRHYLSDFIFKDAIREFISIYPNVHLNINLYSKLDEKKFNEEYDLLIDYSDYTSLINSNNKITLCELSNIIVCGNELYNKYSNVKCVSEIDGSKFMSLCPSRKKGRFEKFCFENNVMFVDIMSMNDSVLRKNMIKENIGLCLVNEDSVKNELCLNEMKKINIKEPIFKDEIIIVYKNNKNQDNIDRFIDILLKQYLK